jgi:predicted nuclease of restriction endonuclease-like RecB superfamily
MGFFRPRASNYRKMVEERIKEEMPDISIKKEPPLLNRSPYAFRPDFVLKRDEKTFIIEAKDQVKQEDVASFKGMVSDFDAQLIIISFARPDTNSSLLAEELSIKLISGPPLEVVKQLKDFISAP